MTTPTNDSDRAPEERGAHETETTTERASVVVRPGLFLTLVIASAFGVGAVIYWLLRTMRI